MRWRVKTREAERRRRFVVLASLVAGAFLVLVGQLGYLQIMTGAEFRERSERNRLRIRTVAAPRGILYDRSGLPLVENRPAFTVALVPAEVEDRGAVLARLAGLLGTPLGEFAQRLDRVPPDSPWPIRLQRGLTLEEVTRLEEWKLELPGIVLEVEPQRGYPGRTFGAHLLGYVREVSEAELKQGRYRRGDLTGQSGLERLYDDDLRGRDGAEQIEVDAVGRPIRVVTHREPIPGAHVHTTIDRRVQALVEQAMEGRTGAAVVLDPRSGEVLALVSTPAFPVASFAGPIDKETWLALVADPGHPLLNRTVQSQYPPGSLFKIVVTAAALQAGIITPFDRLPCPADWTLGRRTFHNWEERDRGNLTLYEALVRSCNTFFYQLGLKVGPERITQMARAFGLGRPTEVGFAGERPGLVPSPAWKRAVLRAPWQAGDTVVLAIGQGQIAVTPLQVARLMAGVANGGFLWRPRLVDWIEAPHGAALQRETSVLQGRVELSPVIFEFLHRALWGVVNDGGTGAAARLPGIAVAGKTGTAQTQAMREGERRRSDRDHAWFAGFAPADDPQVVVVVLVERGGMGGQTAAPIAGRILKGIFYETVAAAGVAG